MFTIPTYEEIKEQILAQIPDELDKREGSLIDTAIGPVCAELCQMYITLQGYYELSFADTAYGEYLERIAGQYGILRNPAEHARYRVLAYDNEGKQTVLEDGLRFSSNGVFLKAEGGFLIAEVSGSEGNLIDPEEILPVSYLDQFGSVEIAEQVAYGKDTEDDESLRERLLFALRQPAYGGNISDYREKGKSLDGVGAVKVAPAANGGGTVTLYLLTPAFLPVEEQTAAQIQEAFSPQGQNGVGIAPIGHMVTVLPANSLSVSVSAAVEYKSGEEESEVNAAIQKEIEGYFLSIRENWEKEEESVVRLSRVESRILDTEGVVDVSSVTLNGSSQNLIFDFDTVPILEGFNAV